LQQRNEETLLKKCSCSCNVLHIPGHVILVLEGRRTLI